jgi:predicted DNA binding CopG/RHH family protein
MSSIPKGKPFPSFRTDEEAEHFVDTADLSTYDFSGFSPMRFEFKAKTANVSMRMPQALLDALKERAKREGVPYQRFIRQTLEQALAGPQRRA